MLFILEMPKSSLAIPAKNAAFASLHYFHICHFRFNRLLRYTGGQLRIWFSRASFFYHPHALFRPCKERSAVRLAYSRRAALHFLSHYPSRRSLPIDFWCRAWLGLRAMYPPAQHASFSRLSLARLWHCRDKDSLPYSAAPLIYGQPLGASYIPFIATPR